MGELLGTPSRVAHERRHPRPYSGVAARALMGCAGSLGNRLGLCRGHDRCRPSILSGVRRGVLTGRLRTLGPPALGPLTAPITRRPGQHLTAFGLHRAPEPLLVRLLLADAPPCVRFDLQASHHPLAVARAGLAVERLRHRRNTVTQKAQEPCEPATDSAPTAAPGKPFHQQACDERTGVIREAALCAAGDQRTAAVVAVIVRFAVLKMAVVLGLGRLTPWTRIADDHRWLLTSAGVEDVFGQPSPGITWRA